MWVGCLLALWTTIVVVVLILLVLGLVIEHPWLLLVPALVLAWRWLRAPRRCRG